MQRLSYAQPSQAPIASCLRNSGRHNLNICVRMAAAAGSVSESTTSTNGASAGKMSAEAFIRPHLLKLAAYTPIEPFEVLSAKLGRKPEDIIKLDANENPYGPPPEVREALGNMQFPNIYPDPENRKLRSELGKLNNVPMENILVGCGADELIDLIMRCVLDPGDAILDCPPTFTMYMFDAAVNNSRVINVPRRPDFSIDTPAVVAAIQEHRPKMVFLTSPNNPDGSLLDDQDLLTVLQQNVLVVLDEAYIEFAGLPSKMSWVLDHPNLIVLRTFSKMAGLAGLRVGYGAFPAGFIDYIWRAKQPYNVSVAAEVAAVAALSNITYLQRTRDALVEERQRLIGLLEAIPYLQPYPSHSNFILCKVDGRDAKSLKDALAGDGIMVRHYANSQLSGYIRISVGLPEHTDILVAALKKV